MSVVAIAGLVENILEQNYIFTIVWVVISFHFIRATRRAIKDKA
jgi:hypothetical protein